jgi:hypothetical protein
MVVKEAMMAAIAAVMVMVMVVVMRAGRLEPR